MTAALLLLAATATAAGCADEQPPAGRASSTTVTANAAQNGVQVTVVLTADTVRATYRPERPGFHLYSMSLPADGIDGVGVPTKLAVKDGLRATGAPTADRPVQPLNLPGVAAALPVYPDGPVTLTLPITRTGSATAQVVVAYGACSSNTCLLPVSGLVIPIRPN
jgi:hypothetical protein